MKPPVAALTADTRYNSLTSRQKDVFDLYARGFSTEEIARELGLSKKTVANYRLAVMDELGVESVMGIRLYAEDHGLLGPS